MSVRRRDSIARVKRIGSSISIHLLLGNRSAHEGGPTGRAVNLGVQTTRSTCPPPLSKLRFTLCCQPIPNHATAVHVKSILRSSASAQWRLELEVGCKTCSACKDRVGGQLARVAPLGRMHAPWISDTVPYSMSTVMNPPFGIDHCGPKGGETRRVRGPAPVSPRARENGLVQST